MIQRAYFDTIAKRIDEPRKFIQIIEGPRQVGKSTLIKQVLKGISMPWVHFSADNVPATRSAWISDCWSTARNKLQMEKLPELLLVIDEVQKLLNWGEVVKKEWDEDTFNDVPIKVVAIEVKSNHEKDTSGLHIFQEKFHPFRSVLVGEEGLPVETFLKSDLRELFE